MKFFQAARVLAKKKGWGYVALVFLIGPFQLALIFLGRVFVFVGETLIQIAGEQP